VITEIVRPSWKEREALIRTNRNAISSAVVGGTALFAGILFRPKTTLAVVVVMIVVGALIWSAMTILYFINSALWIEQDALVKRDWLRRVARHPLGEVGGLLLCSVPPSDRDREVRVAIVSATHGTCLFRMSGRYWSDKNLARLFVSRGLPVRGSWDEIWSRAQLAAQVPGCGSWSEQHPDQKAALVIGSIFGGFAVFVIVASILKLPA
jgi:hypothetical protein